MMKERKTSKLHALSAGLIAGLLVSGCVSSGTHEQALAELDQVRKAAAQQAEADKKRLAEQAKKIAALEAEKEQVGNERLAAQTALGRVKTELDQTKRALEEEESAGKRLRDQLIKAQEDNRQIAQLSGEVRRERDALRNDAANLQRQLETARQDLANREDVLNGTLARVATLAKKEEDLNAALTDARAEARDLKTRLDAERAQVASLQQDKQRLLGGTTTARAEIDRLQKQATTLATEASRVKDLEQQIQEKNQAIAQLREAMGGHDALVATATAQGEDLKQKKQRVEQLSQELAAMGEEMAHVKQERDKLGSEAAKLKEANQAAQAELRRVNQENESRVAELSRAKEALEASLLAQKAAKDAELQRLKKTQEDLTASLTAEIEKGNVRIQQVRDRLTINMVDRILFDSGSAKVKPAGLKVLNQVGAVLKNVTDKQIRIEGHTDNVPIGAGLRDRFATNWELSTARATSVVRHLIDEGGIAAELLTAAGHADTLPVADNDSEDGRSQNRRIEITLYPKDLKGIAEVVR